MAYPRKWLTSSIAGGVALGLVVGFAVKATSDDGDNKTNVDTGTTVVAPGTTAVGGETTVTVGPDSTAAGGETTVTVGSGGETTVTTIAVATTPLPPPASVDTLPVATSRRRPRATTTVPPTAPPPTHPPTTPFVTPPPLLGGS